MTAISTSVTWRTRTKSPFVVSGAGSASLAGATWAVDGEFGPRRPNRKLSPSGGSPGGGLGDPGAGNRLARQLGQVLCCESHLTASAASYSRCWMQMKQRTFQLKWLSILRILSKRGLMVARLQTMKIISQRFIRERNLRTMGCFKRRSIGPKSDKQHQPN